ncbi:hypothetical protein ACFST9_00205 [Hymenobacter monticola]|uniref:Lipoprotein n=1 Tax=Hymenobacter monticola TaxID=1705399 RepID=A0ABY4BCD3_9BACT|nr:hypothetical protein [Hymenobacter monticola]UOE36816.1 hypothetical protein MTP16_25400 [Hymenobacter monticola]
MKTKRPTSITAGNYGRTVLLSLCGLLFGCRSAVHNPEKRAATCDYLSAHSSVYQQLIEQGYAKRSKPSRYLVPFITKDCQGLYQVGKSFNKKFGIVLPCIVTRQHCLLNTAMVDGVYVEDSLAFAARLEQTLTELRPTFTAAAIDSIKEDFLIGGRTTVNPKYLNPYYLRQR